MKYESNRFKNEIYLDSQQQEKESMAESQHIPRTHAPDISETTQTPGLDTTEIMDKSINADIEQTSTPSNRVDPLEIKLHYLANKNRFKDRVKKLEATLDSNDFYSKEDGDTQQQTSDDENLPYYSNGEQETQPDSSATKAPEDRFIPSANRSSYPSKYCAELKPIKDILNTHIETVYAPVIGEYSPKKFVLKI